MVSTAILLAFLALLHEGYAAEGEISLLGGVAEHENFLNEVKSWVKTTVSELRDEVDGGVTELRSLEGSLRGTSEKEIVERYEASRRQLGLMSLPPECRRGGEEAMDHLLGSGLQGFIQCPNLTIAAQDVVGIGFEAAKLTAQLLLTADELMNGFASCWSWNPVKFIWCSFTWVKGSIAEAFRSFKEVRHFMGRIGDLVADIKAQYAYCTNLSKGLADHHTLQVLNQVHKCVLKNENNLQTK